MLNVLERSMDTEASRRCTAIRPCTLGYVWKGVFRRPHDGRECWNPTLPMMTRGYSAVATTNPGGGAARRDTHRYDAPVAQASRLEPLVRPCRQRWKPIARMTGLR